MAEIKWLSTKVDFGAALRDAVNGAKICRDGWNGTGMFIVYQKGYPNGIPCNMNTAIAWGMNEGDNFICRPYLQIKNMDGTHSMWVPSSADVLATDWMVEAVETDTPITNLSFDMALTALRANKKITRTGWNGKDMFVYLVPAGRYDAYTEIAKSIADSDGKVNYAPYMALKTPSGVVSTWVPSINDLLSYDWAIVE